MRIKERKHGRIDLHAHMIPEFYVKRMKSKGIDGALWTPFPKWNPEKDIRVMKRNNISKRILSLSIPGVHTEDGTGTDTIFAKELSRECNEYASQIKREYPKYYGAFATIPFPDKDGAVKEIKYALDVLKLDGVTLFSNISGRYPGEDEFMEIFSELDKRKAVVFIHPEDVNLEYGENKILAPIIERLLDTGRSLVFLFSSKMLSSYPNIKYIISHGGGSFPLITQWLEYYNLIKADDFKMIKDRIYFDTAQQGDFLFQYLKSFCGTSQIVLGTDGGWQSPIQISQTINAFETSRVFTQTDREEIEWKNANKLFPDIFKRLK